jgi:putative flavoprotein involved in K+ transport
VPSTTTVIVGAGHCGLAMSHCLAARSIDHVVLERAEVANSWRTQRWDSLRLLTPNWMTRLPGYRYRGDDPDGYLSAPEVAAMLEDYADTSAAPVLTSTTVTSVRAAGGGYVVRTDQGTWRALTVVLASGAAAVPAVPALARLVPAGLTCLTPAGYRNPGDLPGGGVLVVGASASGIQLADELHRCGHPVTLASASTSACRVPIAAGTSCGGWTPQGCWTSATTRSMIWCGRGRCRPCSWSARRAGRST